MTVRVHHVAGWPQVHTYGDIKVKILETRKGAERLIAVTKTASPYNEEFKFEWDVSSQLTFEVFSEGRLAKDARTLWRVTPGKFTPIFVCFCKRIKKNNEACPPCSAPWGGGGSNLHR